MLKKIIKKIIYKEKYNSDCLCNYINKKGGKIGNNTKFIDTINVNIDMTRPYLIEIGNDVTISDHVTILTHDYSWSIVAKKFPGEIYPILGKIIIGNNCFVGSHAILLCGAKIGNNSIVGAGSVVTKEFPDNVVIAGVPAKIICTIDEYKNKISKMGLVRYNLLVESYKKAYNSNPSEADLWEHYSYFLNYYEIKNKHTDFYYKYRLNEVDDKKIEINDIKKCN